jgi:hypothetical protein
MILDEVAAAVQALYSNFEINLLSILVNSKDLFVFIAATITVMA